MERSVVALVKCGSYDAGEVLAAAKRGIDLLGGIAQFAGKNETILIKPNALNASDPDKCVITHPAVFRAAHGVVSLPKLKTHGLTRITGAVKNQFGCVPGMFKGRYHAVFPDVNDFSRLVAGITAFVRRSTRGAARVAANASKPVPLSRRPSAGKKTARPAVRPRIAIRRA